MSCPPCGVALVTKAVTCVCRYEQHGRCGEPGPTAAAKQGSNLMTLTCRRSWQQALLTVKRSVLSSRPHSPPASLASVPFWAILHASLSYAVRLVSHGLACICGPCVFNRGFDEPEIGQAHLSHHHTMLHSGPNCLIVRRLCLLLSVYMKSLVLLNHRCCTGCFQTVVIASTTPAHYNSKCIPASMDLECTGPHADANIGLAPCC